MIQLAKRVTNRNNTALLDHRNVHNAQPAVNVEQTLQYLSPVPPDIIPLQEMECALIVRTVPILWRALQLVCHAQLDRSVRTPLALLIVVLAITVRKGMVTVIGVRLEITVPTQLLLLKIVIWALILPVAMSCVYHVPLAMNALTRHYRPCVVMGIFLKKEMVNVLRVQPVPPVQLRQPTLAIQESSV